jgi:hypothetical protein
MMEVQATQGLYEITLREEYTKMNKLTRTISLSSSMQTRVSDKSLVDSLEGTVVWECNPIACPQMIMQLYKGILESKRIKPTYSKGAQPW